VTYQDIFGKYIIKYLQCSVLSQKAKMVKNYLKGLNDNFEIHDLILLKFSIGLQIYLPGYQGINFKLYVLTVNFANKKVSHDILCNCNHHFNITCIFIYSYLRFFTGFAIVAFMACEATVIQATNKANAPAPAKYHQSRSILYSKFCSHLEAVQ
jgi:hypothetical protein